MGSVLRKIRSPVWLTTAIVVSMILLFSLLIYHAREREMGEQFNIQQVALAKIIVSGIEDLFSDVERSIRTQSGHNNLSRDRAMQLIYEDLEGRIDLLAAGEDSRIQIYPEAKETMNARDELGVAMKRARIAGKTIVHNFMDSSGQTKTSRVIIAIPLLDSSQKVKEIMAAMLSISPLVERNIDPLRKGFGSNAWIIDGTGLILFHTRPELTGVQMEMANSLESGHLKGSILGKGETKGEFFLVNEKGERTRTIVAHAPVNFGNAQLWIGIGTHYTSALLHMKETVYIVMLEAFILIIAVVIGSAVMITSGRRRVVLEEEVKFLREREKWQEDLAREKRKVEGIIEGSPIASFVIDRNHKIIFWNKACEELTGLRGEDMIGTDNQFMPFYPEKRPVIADIIVDQDLDQGLTLFYGEKEVQPHAIIEGAYEASDFYPNLGGGRHLYFLAAPIYDENGEVIAAIETLQDVSREKQLELDLTNNAANLQDELNKNITLKRTIEGIIEGSPIATFVIDKNHKIILWNKACTELTGFEGREMIGTSRQYEPFYNEKRSVIADVIVDNDMEGLKKYYGKRQMQPSTVVKGAFEAVDFYENLGGKRRHLYFLAAPIYDEKGETIAAVETLQDVTREKEMELNLKEYAESLKNELDVNIRLRKDIEDMNNYLQSILDSSPDRIFDLDSDGIIRFASKDLFSGTDYPKQLRGRHFTEFLDEENMKKLLDQWQEITKGKYKPFEISATARDGSKRDLLISTRPIRNTDRFILVQRDITEFKNLEQKFYESQKLAAVGQLSAGIAHEVRNPLSSIKMSLQILEKRLNPTGNDQKRFKIAQKEVEHLEKLVSDILIFARPVEPDRKPVKVNSFLEHSLSMAEKEIMDKGIKIETRLAGDLPEVFIDQPMMDQVLLNIYLNAVDAMEPGGKLVLSACPAPDNGGFVCVTIEDNGYGIAPEDLAHIFNPFFTRKKYGTGLGLTQVKKIIDQHSGTIEIKSVQGKGTTVVINIPTVETGNRTGI
ncbi:MAG: PAS domain S-box protein [Syntrophaceae bacterium]